MSTVQSSANRNQFHQVAIQLQTKAWYVYYIKCLSQTLVLVTIVLTFPPSLFLLPSILLVCSWLIITRRPLFILRHGMEVFACRPSPIWTVSSILRSCWFCRRHHFRTEVLGPNGYDVEKNRSNSYWLTSWNHRGPPSILIVWLYPRASGRHPYSIFTVLTTSGQEEKDEQRFRGTN